MKYKCVTKLRNFLNRNKIFFEILSSILLSTMALTVSIVSCQINKRQVENEELINMPHFKISKEQFTWKTNNDSEKLTIENVGGYASNYIIDKKIYLSCKYWTYNGEKNRQIYLPIDDILDTSFPSSNYTGIIEEFYSISTINNFNELYQQSLNIEKGSLQIELLYYIVITCADFRNQQHIEYYIVDNVYGGRKIDNIDEKLERLFSIQYPRYRISQITFNQILELLNLK